MPGDEFSYSPSERRPMWREREMGRPCAEADSRLSRCELPTPSEGIGWVEPDWKLHGVHQDAEAETEAEERMEQMEMEKVLREEEEEQHRRQAAEEERLEREARRAAELLEVEKELDEYEEEAVERVQEEYQEEVEGLMRELRAEAQEHVLREVENDMYALHVTSLKLKELEREAQEAEEKYLDGIREQQDWEQEEQEERQMELLLKRQEAEERLRGEADEAIKLERQQHARKNRIIDIQIEKHDNEGGSGITTSCSPLEKYVREEEEALWRENDRFMSVEIESPGGGAGPSWGGLRRAAEQKQMELTAELQERHDMFAERLRKKIEGLHIEAEAVRRNIWKEGGIDFAQSKHLIDMAEMIRENFEEHISMMDEEYRGIAERQALWPPEDTKDLKHPLSAGAFRPREQHGSEGHSVAPFRPATAPRRAKSAREREKAVRDGRSKAPTGFSFGIRAVFEALDRARTGRITPASVEVGFHMLNLDIAKDDLLALIEQAGGQIDFVRMEDMVLQSMGDGSATSRRASRLPTPDAHQQALHAAANSP